MRLTLIIPSLNPGGAERVMGILANYWGGREVSVTLVTYDDGGEKPFYRLDPGIHHVSLNFPSGSQSLLLNGWNFLKRIPAIRKALVESRPDVVISFMETTNVLSLLCMAGTGVPVLVSERTDPFEYRVKWSWKTLRYCTYWMARSVIVQTERSAQYFRSWVRDRVIVIPNPVLSPDVPADGGEDLPVSGPVIISIGRLYPVKGFDQLIEAFSKVSPRHPDWNLVVYGTGEQLASLREQAAARGVGGKVHFPGRIRNPYPVLKKAKIYGLSSRFEGFPNALCEAMASGLPAVAMDCPSGPRAIIRDGVDGMLTPPGDVSAMAEALESLMADPEKRERLGRRAAEITQRFGLENIMTKWEKVLATECGVSPSKDSPRRLTLVVPSLGAGGAERVMSILANYWAAKGVSVILLTYDDDGEPPFYQLDPRVAHKSLDLPSGTGVLVSDARMFLRRIRSLRRNLKVGRPDAVISFMESANVLCLLATVGTGIPVLASERCDPTQNPIKNVWKILRRLTYPFCFGLVAQTERAAEFFRPHLNSKLRVIPNPVLLPDPGQAEEEELPVGGKTIVGIGRLVPQKGFDLLIRAFAAISADHPDWDLVIFGSGSESAALHGLVRELGLTRKVRFWERIRNPFSVYRRVGMYVLASRFEGFPNVLCEAMASGLPVVATDCPSGPREIVRDGVDGLLVPNEDVPALGAAMARLMENPALRRELGSRATEITGRFGIESVMGLWEAVLKEKCRVIL